MGLSFGSGASADKEVTTSTDLKRLKIENIRFLEKIGLKINNNGYTEYNTGTDIRRNLMGKGISHAQPLRFVQIKQ